MQSSASKRKLTRRILVAVVALLVAYALYELAFPILLIGGLYISTETIEISRVTSPDGLVDVVITRTDAGALESFYYDFYIVPWARAAAEYKHPLFLRFAHEMNDPYRYPWGPQNGNRPEDFVAAWKHVHLIFQKMGATNVLWVWSPHISMPWFEFYYPGPEFVDWIGVGVLNYGTIASWSRACAKAAPAAIAGPESRRIGSSNTSASRPISASCSSTMKR